MEIKRQPFVLYLIIRIFPPLLLLVLFFTWMSFDQSKRSQIQMETLRLHSEAERIYLLVEDRLDDLSWQAGSLAENDLIVGSLIDAKMRDQVLPVFFQSLKVPGLHGDTAGTLALLDYKGRVIASNRPMAKDPEAGAWLADIEGGEEYRRIDDTGLTLYRVVTLYHPESREGAVAIRLDPRETCRLLDIGRLEEKVSIVTGFGDHSFDSPFHEQSPANGLIQARVHGGQGGWIREVIVSTDEGRLLSEVRRAFYIDLALLAAGAGILIILLFWVVKNAVRPVERMSMSLGRIVGHNDLTTRLEGKGPAEIQHLSLHINEMLNRLGKSTRSVEEFHAVAENQRILLDNIPVQVWYLTTVDKYGAVNRAHADFMGKDPKILAHRNLCEFLPPDVADVCRAGNLAVFETAEPTVTEECVPDGSGGSRLLSITKTPKLGRDGTVEFVVCSALDITERRQMEVSLEKARDEAESAARAKSNFLANMSHEIRTPLTAILGFADILGRDPSLSSDQAEKIDIINRSGEHLLNLINDILDIAKIESGRITTEINGFSLAALMDDLTDLFHPQVSAKGLQWQLEKAGVIPPFIAADGARLRQVLINLVGNAVKFTNSGKITVRARMDEEVEYPARLRLTMEIEDTGPGIAGEDLAHIFEAFQQGNTILPAGGTGLGLPISRRLVELMGGELTVKSRQGEGSCFRFCVPVKTASGGMKMTENPSRVPIGPVPGSGLKRILVVDDSKANLDLLSAMLTPMGFEIRTAQNGAQALEKISEWDPHAVLMDIRMPEMDGYEAIRRLKANRETADIPVIVNTAVVLEEGEKAMLEACTDGFVGKPFKQEELFEVLGKALRLEYVYTDTESESLDIAGAEEELSTLAAEDIALLPEHLIQAIREALEIGDVQEIRKLELEIKKIDAGVAKKVHNLSKNYDYDSILRVIL